MPDRTLEDLLAQYQDTPDEEFVRLLVHDLRGPLSSMISANTLLENEELDHAQLRELGQILLKTTDNMRTVLDAALAHDRIQRDKAPEADE